MIEVYIIGCIIGFLASMFARHVQRNTSEEEMVDLDIDKEIIAVIKKERSVAFEVITAAIWTFLWPIILLAIIYSILKIP
jgi:hypothetical protein